MRSGVYRALRLAVEAYGGADELAEDMGATRSDTYARVARVDGDKGLQRAFIDFLAYIFRKPSAAMVWAAETNKLLDLEPPLRRPRVTADDIGRAWLRSLDSLPPGEREGRRRDMAAALGIRPEDLR